MKEKTIDEQKIAYPKPNTILCTFGTILHTVTHLLTKFKTYIQQKVAKTPLLQDRLLKNFVSLGSIQVLNLLFPLLLTPYLVKVIGITNFGLISFSQAVIIYFITLNDYGFNLSTTRDITLHKGDKNKIEQIYRDTLSTKFFLLLAGFVVYFALIFFLSKDYETILFYLLSYSMVVGHSLFSVWLFQGMEEMKYISFINAVSKLVTLILVIVFVRQETDYIYVNLFYGVGAIAAGVTSLIVAKKKFNLTFRLSTWGQVVHQLKEGWHIFVSNFAVNLYLKSNILVLGIFASKEIVGFYSIAENVINIIRQIMSVYFQAIYPHICRLVLKTKEEIRAFVKKIHVAFTFLILLLSLGVFTLSEYITLYFADQLQEDVVKLTMILSLAPIIVVLNIPANQLLLAYNIKKPYSRILMAGSFLNLGLNLGLSYFFLAYGTAFSVLFTEVFITVGLYVALEKNQPIFTKRTVPNLL